MLRQAVPKLTVVDLTSAEHALADPTATGSVTEADWQFHRALHQAARWPRGLAIIELLHAAVSLLQTHLDHAMRTVIDFLRSAGQRA